MNYYNKLLSHTLLSKEETYDLIIQYQSSECPFIKQQIEGKIIKHNFKLIWKLSCKFHNNFPDLPLDDCIQSSCLGILRAIEKFDISRNLEFSTYFYHWVGSYLQRAYQKYYRTIVIPVHIQESQRKIAKFSKQFFLLNGRQPTTAEVALDLNITIVKVKEVLSHKYKIPSLNNIISTSDTSTELMDLIADNEAFTPNDFLTSIDLLDTLNTLLDILQPLEKEALQLRYGLNGNSPHTLNAVGQTMGISRESSRSLLHKATNKLRKNKDLSNLKQFL